MSATTRSLSRLLTAARVLAFAGVVSLAGASRGDTVFQTAAPDGGFFGYIGFDVFTQQSVGARFIPSAAYTLDSASIWFMSNDFDGTTPQTVTVTLRTDVNPGGGFTSVPSGVILETWTMNVPVVGWSPQLIQFNSQQHPALASGQKYWLVAESQVGPGVNPVWVWSAQGNEFTAQNQGGATAWQSGNGAAIGVEIHGTPAGSACAVDYNHSGGVDVQDIFAFLNGWFAGDSAADFNHAGGLNVQDIFDFLSAWFAGC